MRHRRWPLTTWVLILAGLTGLGFLGGRWLLLRFYPLPYQSMVTASAAEYGLDPYLVTAVIRVESGFKPRATSKQGARGLMQIMPETGQWIAGQMKIAYNPDMLYDPEYNIRIGTWYLAELHREFAQDTVVALAAYNGGRTNVREWLSARQWTGENKSLDQIPFAETRRYVAKVLRDLRLYQWLYGDNSPARKEISHVGSPAL